MENTICLALTRQSVCMADDCNAPHLKILHIKPLVNTMEFIQAVLQNFEIPHMANCSWGVWLNEEYIATLECNTGLILPLKNELYFLTENKLYFSYILTHNCSALTIK